MFSLSHYMRFISYIQFCEPRGFVGWEPFPKCRIVFARVVKNGYNTRVWNPRHKKGEKEMRGLSHYVLVPLMFIGALNWGLIGIFGFDLVAFLFGPATLLTNIVYSLVGIAAVAWLIILLVDGQPNAR